MRMKRRGLLGTAGALGLAAALPVRNTEGSAQNGALPP